VELNEWLYEVLSQEHLGSAKQLRAMDEDMWLGNVVGRRKYSSGHRMISSNCFCNGPGSWTLNGNAQHTAKPTCEAKT
jgi:hypothetical protein